MMKKSHQILYHFSQIYDLISVGPYAHHVNQAVSSQLSRWKYKSLSILQSPILIEPNLYHYGKPIIKLSTQGFKGNFQLDYGVKKIIPQKNTIMMENGNIYKYKNLVYSGYPYSWKDYEYLQKSIDSKLRKEKGRFGSQDFENLDFLYSQIFGITCIFIPKQRHCGYDNYFMLHLKQRLERNIRYKTIEDIKILVLNEGKSLFPFQEQIIKKQIQQSNKIQIINDCQIKDINYRQKNLKINGIKTKFNGFFHYEPIKIPSILLNSQIDPFSVDTTNLHHSAYDNIYVLGNSLPNIQSFDLMKKTSKLIIKNLQNKFLGVSERFAFDGKANISFWTGQNRQVLLKTNEKQIEKCYEGKYIENGLNIWNKFSYEFTLRKHLGGKQEREGWKLRDKIQFSNIKIPVN